MQTPQKDPENDNKVSQKIQEFWGRFNEDYKFGYRGTSQFSHKLLWISAIFIVVALIWAYYANLQEVTSAQGKVIPSKQMQVIQNLEGGIVKEILVHQGQIVQKGQIIAYLDKTIFKSEYEAAQQKDIALRIKIARLYAQINNKPFVLTPEFQKGDPSLFSSELALYNTQINELRALQSQRDLISKEISMTDPLIKTGDVSKVDIIHLQESLADVDNKILSFKSTALDELNKTKADLASLDSDLDGLQDKLARTTIVSPVKGIINEIYVNTVGGVIKPGDNLMDIVPLGDTLLVEAKVKPSDIGFIHVGQEALVKITAYDYSIYGGLKGTVEYISSDTLKDDKDPRQEAYYQIHVRTKQTYLQAKDGKRLYIIPGMTASADILTGHKTVLDYILKPILKARQSALTER
jgi:membrane fusion protein, adhesin transport system